MPTKLEELEAQLAEANLRLAEIDERKAARSSIGVTSETKQKFAVVADWAKDTGLAETHDETLLMLLNSWKAANNATE